ncbi:MAG: menaquinone biosynthetic enzyme MqnA/MqnD family protein [Candidatus Udaeobacter sp.]
MNSLHVGCVKYLNARPLIRGWPGNVEFDHPSALCQRLAEGQFDVALVSSFEFLRNPIYRIVDDVSISSDGPVYSVIVAHRGEFSDIEEIELDPASTTAVNLLRCLLAELGLTPRLIGSSSESAESSRARLIIGDQAIRFRQNHGDAFEFWDLGEQWKKLSGLPFVYALWLIRPEIPDVKSIAQRLRELRDQNLAEIAVTVSDAADNKQKITGEFLVRYYNEHLRFGFGTREKQALQTFANLCAKHGVLPTPVRKFNVV